jgi:hypothetical protein
VVVYHDIAGPPLESELTEAPVDASDVTRDRSGLERRRLGRLAQLAPLPVAQHAPKSSDSRMIDEYAMRASLCPISTAIASSAPAITAVVIGSTLVPTFVIAHLLVSR